MKYHAYSGLNDSLLFQHRITSSGCFCSMSSWFSKRWKTLCLTRMVGFQECSRSRSTLRENSLLSFLIFVLLLLISLDFQYHHFKVIKKIPIHTYLTTWDCKRKTGEFLFSSSLYFLPLINLLYSFSILFLVF